MISVQEPAQGDDGLPADIVGRGVAGVKADLESRGYTVKTEKRLSSKKYVGKVSGSIPGLGSKLSDGQTVTLYEGRGFDGWGEGAGFKCEWWRTAVILVELLSYHETRLIIGAGSR